MREIEVLVSGVSSTIRSSDLSRLFEDEGFDLRSVRFESGNAFVTLWSGESSPDLSARLARLPRSIRGDPSLAVGTIELSSKELPGKVLEVSGFDSRFRLSEFLTGFFSSQGTVESLHLVPERKSTVLVTYDSIDSARLARDQLGGKFLLGGQIHVEYATSTELPITSSSKTNGVRDEHNTRVVFVGNLGRDVSRESLRSVFESRGFAVIDVNLKTHFGFVTVTNVVGDESELLDKLRQCSQPLGNSNQVITVELAKQTVDKMAVEQKRKLQEPTKRIFLVGFANKISEDAIFNELSRKVADILTVTIPPSKRYCFVTTRSFQGSADLIHFFDGVRTLGGELSLQYSTEVVSRRRSSRSRSRDRDNDYQDERRHRPPGSPVYSRDDDRQRGRSRSPR